MIDVDDLRARYRQAAKFLDERGRRLFAADEALALGYGGVSAASAATGSARSTIRRAIVELRGGVDPIGSRVRRPGGGRERAVVLQPDLPAALEALIEDAIRGDPEAPPRRVSRSQRQIARALLGRGFRVGQKLVGLLPRGLGYGCQANRKTREGTSHPDRDARFAHIDTTVRKAIAAGEPAISADTEKKGLVGDFKNPGRGLRPKGNPEPVRVHDFELPESGEVAPYGVHGLAADAGRVSVGVDADTAASAVESIRRRWRRLGRARCPEAKRLVIAADRGGGDGVRLRLWKRELQRFANETGLAVTVAHLPPGTSKWNRIEHRLFATIPQNWRGKPLVSHQVIVHLIGATTTRTGLTVRCEPDANCHPKGIKITAAGMATLAITRDPFHGEWNHTISPNQQPT